MTQNTDQAAALARLTGCAQYGPLHRLPCWHDVKAEDIEPGISLLLEQTKAQFEDLANTAKTTWQDLMVPLEKLEHALGQPASRIGHLQAVRYSADIKNSYEKIRPQIIALGTEISQSRPLYEKIKQLQDQPGLSPTQQRIIAKTLQGMELCGVHLSGEQQEKFKSLAQALSERTEAFQNNLIEAAKTQRVKVTDPSQLSGLPEAVISHALETARADGVDNADEKAGPWHFAVNASNYIPIIERGESAELRESMYRAFRSQGTHQDYDNRPLIYEILALRQEKAALLGFDNFAELSLSTKMAPSVAAVDKLMTEIRDAAIPAADRELEALKSFMATHLTTDAASDDNTPTQQAPNLNPWDVAFWKERYAQAHFEYDQEQVRNYLQVPIVLEKLFGLMGELFELEIQPVDTKDIPIWHPDVSFYEVKEAGEVIAGFYMDLYARSGEKREGAWMNTTVDRSANLAPPGQNTLLPIALFVMNARPPQSGKPGLFSLNEAETLFHEFGHALQHMLTRVDEGSASGINLIEWDAVEVASQFNENWLYRAEFLKEVSCHVETKEPLTDALIERILESRKYWAGNFNLRQLLFAETDLRIHEQCGHAASPSNPDPFNIEKSLRDSLIRTPVLPEESQLPAFTHLFSGGYAAGYYSYKWAEVMAADAFGVFEAAGLSNLEAIKPIAKQYRETLLAEGGSRSALEVFRSFMGRDASAKALLQQQGLLAKTA
jgi:oligopeptidase A